MSNLALFDFDSTITFNDNFTPFIRVAVTPRGMAIGKVLLSPLIIGYKLGIISSSFIRRCVVAVGFRGRRESEIRQLGLDYSRQVLPLHVRPEAMERIAWHKSQGDVIVVVSASMDVYLSDWCRQHGLDLICSELETSEGILTGRYRGGDCTGKEKARRVREKYDIASYPVIYAYGDSSEDRDLLAMAHVKYFRWKEVS